MPLSKPCPPSLRFIPWDCTRLSPLFLDSSAWDYLSSLVAAFPVQEFHDIVLGPLQ